jgi:ribosome-associated toxin RatA of RatAB toxin-antitoxin module
VIAALLVSAALAGARDADLDADPITVVPPSFAFDDAERSALQAGEVVYRYERWGVLDGGVAAIVVDAPADIVWKHIVDYDDYVRFLPYVTASSTDNVVRGLDTVIYDCSMELTTKGIVTRYQVRNWHFPDRGYMTFRMLPMAGNPLDSATGYWRLEAFDGDPARTILAYRIDIDTSWYVPAFLKNRAADRGLPTVARLIAREAEKEAGTWTPPPK